MDYQRIYDEFIADRRAKELALVESGEYYERHHILPKSLGGGDQAENIICLKPGDHLFAHVLLAKVHGGVHWASVWAMAGMSQRTRRNRCLSWVLRRRKWADTARKKAAPLHRGRHSGRANLTTYEWINSVTGETLIGTRHDLPVKHTAKKETSDYFRGVCMATLSGWFTTDRFPTIEAFNQAVAAKRKQAADAGRKQAAKQMGGNNPGAVAVKCVDTGDVFASCAEAASWAGYPRARGCKIGQVCRGEKGRKTFAGYIWAYA